MAEHHLLLILTYDVEPRYEMGYSVLILNHLVTLFTVCNTVLTWLNATATINYVD